MNTSLFIASKIIFKSKRTFSKVIVRIAVAGIMLSLAVMMIAVAVVKGFKHEIQQKVRGFSNDIQLMSYTSNSSFENIPFVLNDTTIQALKSNPNIDFFQTYATKPAIMTTKGEVEGVNFKGVEEHYRWSYLQSKLLNGRVLSNDSIKRNAEILISSYTAKRLNLKVNDTFIMYFVQDPPRKRKFKIVGIYNIGVDEIDKSFVIGSLALVQKINKWSSNEIGAVEIAVKDFSKVDSTSQQLYENIQVNLASSAITNTYSVIFEWLGLLDVNTQVILILMLIVGVINMISALLIIILERTNMIGILKALGANNRLLIRVFLYNAFYLIGLGAILGNILGLGFILFQSNTHFFTLDQASYYMNWVPVRLHWQDVIWLNLGTVTICTLVMLVPVLLVTKISPIRAIVFK